LEAGNDDGWYRVMDTDDPERIDRVIARAEQEIPLAEVATGPGEKTGLGPGWSHHGHLDFVVQGLRGFPGKGWRLIRAALRSPVVRNRHMALRALSSWDREDWPNDARPLLEQALREEPDGDVRTEIETLLAGKQIEDPVITCD
jgi:hypothetical protein